MPEIKSLRAVLAATVIACLFTLSTTTAQARTCRNSTKVAAGTTLGSQVDGEIVTICLDKKLLRKVSVTTAPMPQPAPKQTLKPKPVLKPSPVARKLAPILKPKPRVRTRLRGKSNGSADSFRPNLAPLVAKPLSVKPLQTVHVASVQSTKLAHAVLSGSRVLVRLTPVALDLDYGDGTARHFSAANLRDSHGYASQGSYSEVLHVTFRAQYRLESGTWLEDPEPITMAAKPVVIKVGDGKPSKSREKVVLVTPQ
jgi:hypothetical protein